jgi:hypothetical protein
MQQISQHTIAAAFAIANRRAKFGASQISTHTRVLCDPGEPHRFVLVREGDAPARYVARDDLDRHTG